MDNNGWTCVIIILFVATIIGTIFAVSYFQVIKDTAIVMATNEQIETLKSIPSNNNHVWINSADVLSGHNGIYIVQAHFRTHKDAQQEMLRLGILVLGWQGKW